ncbi:MAG: hypothetical protein HPY81_03345 [Firmicutes bacterium]|nr:hypothetical protein [Bacillota bacterium]
MEYRKVEELYNELTALCPVYQPGLGDATEIITNNGGHYLDRRTIRGVRNALARQFALDQQAAREIYGELVGRRALVPLPLSIHLILIPVKLRRPVTANDSAYGYVAVNQVSGLVTSPVYPRGCRLQLLNGYCLDSPSSRETVSRTLGDGRLIAQRYCDYIGAHRAKLTSGRAGEESGVLSNEGLGIAEAVVELAKQVNLLVDVLTGVIQGLKKDRLPRR